MLASLPMAVAIALSPFAIIPAILVLLTPRPRAAGGAFLIGWLLGVATASGLAVATALPGGDAADSPAWMPWLRLALGGALLAMGIVCWRGRARAGSAPAWLQGIQGATPPRAFVLGLALSIANPKVLLLALAGGLAIGTTGDGWLHGLAHVLGFTVLASISVAAPWLAFLLAADRAMPVLEKLRLWLEARANTIMAVVFMALGLLLLAKGMG